MASEYQEHVARWKGGCGSDICPGATRIVFARGSVPCDFLFVGEAPGPSEDVLGRPFVGPAGHLIDDIVRRSGVGDYPHAFYNLVGCFPRDSGGDKMEPPDEAIVACAPRLGEFIGIARPKVLVCVGDLSKTWLLGSAKKRRDSVFAVDAWSGDIISIAHPASILRQNDAVKGIAVQRCVAALANAVEALEARQNNGMHP